jgi:hypothetical protein
MANNTKQSKNNLIDITTKGGIVHRPFFGNIEITLFEKLYKNIMKSKFELNFIYNPTENKFLVDKHDLSSEHLTKLFRMIEEAKRLGSIYKEMYSEDPKYFTSFQFFPNAELYEWMQERLHYLNEATEFFHFDTVENELFVRLGTSYEKYSISNNKIVFFNKEIIDSEKEKVLPGKSINNFTITKDFEFTTITNIRRMANTLYRSIYAMNPLLPNKLPDFSNVVPIDYIQVNVDFKNPVNNKVSVILQDY